MVEDIGVRVLTFTRCEPESVDTEEWPELVDKVLLFDICAGSRRYPELLRVIRDLVVGETHGAEDEEHHASKSEETWVSASDESQVVGEFLKH